jgi:hypothetical protein
MDWDLWCRLARSGARFRYLPEPLAAVRYYPGTKTLSGNRKRYMEVWRIERKYGGRLLPRSWLGLYLYDLLFKTQQTAGEAVAFALLQSLRSLKKSLFRSAGEREVQQRTIYGFHRWEPAVEGGCTIHLPWYDPRAWKRIDLRVEPADRTFEVAVNDLPAERIRAAEGRLRVDLPALLGPHRRISIRCCDAERWRLVQFGCEFR